MSTDKIPKDTIIEKIKILYDLGESGRCELIERTAAVMEGLLMLGKSGKNCVDFHMDKGVKTLELGISLVIALDNVKDEFLSELDRELKVKIFSDPTNVEMLAEWKKMQEQNRP